MFINLINIAILFIIDKNHEKTTKKSKKNWWFLAIIMTFFKDLINFYYFSLGSGATKNTDEGPVLQGIVSFGSSECGTLGAPCKFWFKFFQTYKISKN